MPVKRGKKQVIIPIFLVLFILFLDQSSKSLIYNKLQLGESIPVVKHILNITFVKNTGAAFGLFKNNTWFFIIVSILAIAIILVTIYKTIKKSEFFTYFSYNLGLLMIMAGAIGNLIDRIRFGYVIDFIDFRIWPVFNVADSSITIGTLMITVCFVKSKFNISCIARNVKFE